MMEGNMDDEIRMRNLDHNDTPAMKHIDNL